MSDLTSAHRAPFGRLSYAALVLAVGSAVFYVLASTVDDGLYVVTGALGIVAFALGVKARRDARRGTANGRLALVAIVVGGLLGGAVVAFTIAWGIYHLVT